MVAVFSNAREITLAASGRKIREFEASIFAVIAVISSSAGQSRNGLFGGSIPGINEGTLFFAFSN